MITTITPLRRVAVTLAMAGVAAFGAVAIAPAAFAAEDSGVVLRDGNNGPDAFVELDHGKMPVFECDPTKPNQRHNNCIDVTGATRF